MKLVILDERTVMFAMSDARYRPLRLVGRRIRNRQGAVQYTERDLDGLWLAPRRDHAVGLIVG
jgi:hypothetical protein